MKKKGQAVSFSEAPILILLLVTIVLITAAGSTALNSFRQTQCSGSWDGSQCWTDSNQNITLQGHAYNTSTQGLSGLSNFSLQLPTVGTMIGVGLILVVVIGVFAFFARR